MIDLQEKKVHVAIWNDATAAMAAEVMSSVHSQHRRCGGERLLYVGVIPEGAPLPDGATRKALAEGMKQIADVCDYMCIIFQGEGLKASTFRAAFSGVLLMAMKGRWQVAARIEELVAKAGGDLRRVEQLRCAARLAAEKGYQL
jgi:hypothetical protein